VAPDITTQAGELEVAIVVQEFLEILPVLPAIP
jgi:hypothetical protein